MSATEPERRAPVQLTVALWLALVAAAAPLREVIERGPWIPGTAALAAVLLAAGLLLRRAGAPAVAVSAALLAAWTALVTAVFFPDEAFLGIIPSAAVIDEVPARIAQASQEIYQGVAPLTATGAVSFIVVAAMGLLTIALDHVVITARLPLMGAIALVAVWLIPAIAVPSGVDLLDFALMAAAVLFLLRSETRERESPEQARRTGPVTAVAITMGTVAVVAALVVAPALPAPVAGRGSGVAATIDATLDLGEDLRRAGATPVLTARSDAPAPPYLRVATLSSFDGDVWVPDRLRTVPLAEGGLEPVEVADGIRLTEYRTSVEISGLASAYLPVPYPAVGVSGLDGTWRAAPYGRTVLTAQGSTLGEGYEVVTHVPRPTAEQIRSAQALIGDTLTFGFSLPADTPAIVAETAAQVTATATTDYDRLLAMQDWFRGSSFTYSLTTPVEDGYDGSGTAAVARFLEVREGYCVHFAGAFALMARTLDMPSRVVVGFLPGAYTGESVDGQRVTEVSTEQLHAWPEVHFEGIGWVAFEPTKSLGTATRFAASGETDPDSGGQDVTGAEEPLPSASAPPTQAPADRDADAGSAAGPGRAADPRPFLLTVGIVLLVVLAPGAARVLRERMRMRRARRGDVASAWRVVTERAVDLGIPSPASDSPRAFAARLLTDHGAPAAEMSRLVDAIEQASYARDEPRIDLTADAAAVCRALVRTAKPGARVRARLLPRSLVLPPQRATAEPMNVA